MKEYRRGFVDKSGNANLLRQRQRQRQQHHRHQQQRHQQRHQHQQKKQEEREKKAIKKMEKGRVDERKDEDRIQRQSSKTVRKCAVNGVNLLISHDTTQHNWRRKGEMTPDFSWH